MNVLDALFGRARAWLLQPAIDQLAQIMSKISEFAARQTAFNAQMKTDLAGLADDVTSLNDKITQLQNSPGEITAEDQALLDQLVSEGEALSTSLRALNDKTPPPLPPVTA